DDEPGARVVRRADDPAPAAHGAETRARPRPDRAVSGAGHPTEAGAAGGGSHPAMVKLAVLGDPLRYTPSPDPHRAGCAALGLECESVALRPPAGDLAGTLARLAAEGYTGCNLTMPLKEPALALAARPSAAATRARSVNTIRFAPAASGWLGET